MKRIVVTIEGGMLTGVYADGENDFSVELIDYDNIAGAGEDSEEAREASEFERELVEGKLKNFY